MTIKVKSSGAYADIVGIKVKQAGVYADVHGVYAKVAGAYQSVLDSYKFASNRTLFASSLSSVVAGNQYEASKLVFRSPPYEVKSPRLCFPAFYVKTGASGNETAIGNNIAFEGIRISINGVVSTLTAGGSATPTATNGSYFWTDENDLVIPANTLFQVWQANFVATGGFRPNALNGQPTDGANGSTISQSARLTSGSFTAPGRLTAIYGPCAIVAKGWESAGRPPVPLVAGDSIGWGANDWNNGIYPDGVSGYIGRGLNDSASSTRYAYGNFCAPGTRLTNLSATAGEFALRKQLLADVGNPFTSVLLQMGINTISNTGVTASAIADYDAATTFIKTLGSRPIIGMTYLPQTSDATLNKWTDLASQVAASATTHTGLTNYIKTLPVNITAVIDAESYFCDAGFPAKWKIAPFRGTIDANVSSGTSLALTATSAESPVIDDWIVIGAGTANWEIRKVYAVTGTYPNFTLTINSAMAKAHLATEVVAAQYTEDGTHPTTAGSLLGVPAIVAAKNAGIIV